MKRENGSKKTSAYFSDDDASSMTEETCTEREKNDGKGHNVASVIKFPLLRSHLWIRSRCGSEAVISPQSVIPSILMNASSIRACLGQHYAIEESGDDSSNVEFVATLLSNAQLSGSDYHALHLRSPRVSNPENFCLLVNPTSRVLPHKYTDKIDECRRIRIPISTRRPSDVSLLFDDERTRSLLMNLGKGIQKGTKYSLRSCMRVRAACRSHHGNVIKALSATSNSSAPKQQQQSQQQGVSIRYEALLPDMSFRAVQIHSLPLMATHLTSTLTGTFADSTSASRSLPSAPNVGYLTMSSTRQLVPLTQTDSSSGGVMSTPVVGVWVYMPDIGMEGSRDGRISSCLDGSTNRQPTCILNNPYIWGSCVWYIQNENILERVWEEPDLFLLVVFTPSGVFHFEISVIAKHHQSAPFVSMDVLVDLHSSISDSSSDCNETVVCAFRTMIGAGGSVCHGLSPTGDDSVSTSFTSYHKPHPDCATGNSHDHDIPKADHRHAKHSIFSEQFSHSPMDCYALRKAVDTTDQTGREGKDLNTSSWLDVSGLELDTPQPRNPQSLPPSSPLHATSPSHLSASSNYAKSAQRQRQADAGVSASHHSDSPRSSNSSLRESVPLSVYLQQQELIQLLQNEIMELKETLSALQHTVSKQQPSPLVVDTADMSHEQIESCRSPVTSKLSLNSSKEDEEDTRSVLNQPVITKARPCEASGVLVDANSSALSASSSSRSRVPANDLYYYIDSDVERDYDDLGSDGDEEEASFVVPSSFNSMEMEAPSMFNLQHYLSATQAKLKAKGPKIIENELTATCPIIPESCAPNTQERNAHEECYHRVADGVVSVDVVDYSGRYGCETTEEMDCAKDVSRSPFSFDVANPAVEISALSSYQETESLADIERRYL